MPRYASVRCMSEFPLGPGGGGRGGIPLGPFQIFTKIREDIINIVFIAGVTFWKKLFYK
jgi:hypothetical protein